MVREEKEFPEQGHDRQLVMKILGYIAGDIVRQKRRFPDACAQTMFGLDTKEEILELLRRVRMGTEGELLAPDPPLDIPAGQEATCD